MKLISMKNTPKEIAEEKSQMASPANYDMPEYPYGLSICLSEESIAKLGLSGLPQAGDEMIVVAMVKVSRVASTETDGGINRGLDLQITDLSLDPAKKDPNKVAKKMYGG